MPVAERAQALVAQLDDALARAVREETAVARVELGGRDHFGELLHVCGLDVHNVEALVGDIEIPQIDAQVVSGEERLGIAVHRD